MRLSGAKARGLLREGCCTCGACGRAHGLPASSTHSKRCLEQPLRGRHEPSRRRAVPHGTEGLTRGEREGGREREREREREGQGGRGRGRERVKERKERARREREGERGIKGREREGVTAQRYRDAPANRRQPRRQRERSLRTGPKSLGGCSFVVKRVYQVYRLCSNAASGRNVPMSINPVRVTALLNGRAMWHVRVTECWIALIFDRVLDSTH